MEPISNADRLVLLLRQKLQERAKATSAAKQGAKPASDVAGPSEPSGVLAPIPVESADERPFRRAVIQNILADQLGPALINDAQFQHVVSRVADAIEDDPDASELLSRVIADLRR